MVDILFVDDDEMFLEMLEIKLGSIPNIHIVKIASPEVALEYVEANNVDIIFVDFFMPQMTGEEFVVKLRTSGNNALVILQTGYADKIPPIEMIETMNIQGYFDKTKDPIELELLVRSTIKTHLLLKTIQEQAKKIDRLSYKNEFIGSLIVNVTDGIKTQMATIEAGATMLEQSVDRGKRKEEREILGSIRSSATTASKVLKALNFDTVLTNDIYEMMEIIKIITRIRLLSSHCSVQYCVPCEELVNCKSNILILALLEVIVTLSNNEQNEIKVACEVRENTIEIHLMYEHYYGEEELKGKIERIIAEDNNIQFEIHKKDMFFTVAKF